MVELHKAGHLGGCVKGGDPGTYYPKLWEWLAKKYAIKTVLDVGCGEGHALRWFQSHGCQTNGIDGLIDCLPFDCTTVQVDLTKSMFMYTERNVKTSVDLVWCCEVVEHIEEKYIANLMLTLANGKIVAMTHALPGQGGYHHVNCKPKEYWIEQFKRYGYKLLVEDTNESKKYGHKYWTASGMIFEK